MPVYNTELVAFFRPCFAVIEFLFAVGFGNYDARNSVLDACIEIYLPYVSGDKCKSADTSRKQSSQIMTS